MPDRPAWIACGNCGHLGAPKLSLTQVSWCCRECLSWSYVEIDDGESLRVFQSADQLGGRDAVRDLARERLRSIDQAARYRSWGSKGG